jgi:glycosyltransferase involved in cell wall biosynthesis
MPKARKTVIMVRSNAVDPCPRVEKAARFLSDDYDVTVLCWDRRREAERTEARDGYRIHRCRLRADYGRGIRNIFTLAGWVTYQFFWFLVHKADVVHAFDFDTYLPAMLAAKIKRKKIVYDICDFYADMVVNVPEFVKRLIRKADLWLIRFADAVIIADDNRRQQIEGCHPKRLIVIYNAPPDCYATLSAKSGSRSEADRFTLGYVGVLQKERGFDTLIATAFECPWVNLVIGGFGSAEFERELMAHTQGSGSITFLGKVSPYAKTLEVLSRSDALFALYDPAVPNHRFSSPNKVFEAMMLGKPIIVTRNTSMDRLVDEHGCGLTVDYGNTTQLKEAIMYLREARDRGDDRYRRNGRNAYLTCFHPDILKTRLLTLYCNILCS